MWKPYQPFYIPCRQATSEECRALEGYLMRDLAAQLDAALEQAGVDENSDEPVTVRDEDGNDLIMTHEIASREVFSLTMDSIIIIFDWQYYQTSSLIPRHDPSQHFPRVMCVFRYGKPDQAELFSFEHDGTFHRLVNEYHPENILAEGEFQETSHLF